MKSGKKWRSVCEDALLYLLGSALYAAGVNVFVSPNDLVPGGVTGIALVIDRLFGLPVGAVILCINLPLFFAAWRVLGREFTVRTLICTVLSSVMIDLSVPFIPVYQNDRLLAALFGGLCSGAGLGLIYLRGGTTGGTEIIARLLECRFPHIPIGRLLLIVDAVVIAFGAFVYRDVDAVMYAAILVAVTSTLIDRVLAGMDSGKMLLISTEHPETLTAEILSRIDRGVTRLTAYGGYSGQERPMLLCAVRRTEFYPLTQLVASLDPDAFVIILPTDWVYGNGFRRLPPTARRKRAKRARLIQKK